MTTATLSASIPSGTIKAPKLGSMRYTIVQLLMRNGGVQSQELYDQFKGWGKRHVNESMRILRNQYGYNIKGSAASGFTLGDAEAPLAAVATVTPTTAPVAATPAPASAADPYISFPKKTQKKIAAINEKFVAGKISESDRISKLSALGVKKIPALKVAEVSASVSDGESDADGESNAD